MNYSLEVGKYQFEGLPADVQAAVAAAANVIRDGRSYTDKRNEFGASVVSETTGAVFSAGNFLSLDANGEIEAKECAEGTALAAARAVEGPHFILGAVVILNHVRPEIGDNGGASFGPCDRCRASLIASSVSVADRLASRSKGTHSFADVDHLHRIPVISGVFDENNESGCSEVLVIPLGDLTADSSICYDTRAVNIAVPLQPKLD